MNHILWSFDPKCGTLSFQVQFIFLFLSKNKIRLLVIKNTQIFAFQRFPLFLLLFILLKDDILSNIKLINEIYGDWRVCFFSSASFCNWHGMVFILLHCSIAQDLWSFSFSLIGGQWGIPLKVIDLFSCWKSLFLRHSNGPVWHATLSIMRAMWKEREKYTFNSDEVFYVLKQKKLGRVFYNQLKSLFLRSLYEWKVKKMVVIGPWLCTFIRLNYKNINKFKEFEYRFPIIGMREKKFWNLDWLCSCWYLRLFEVSMDILEFLIICICHVLM